MKFQATVLAAVIGSAAASYEKIKTFTPLTSVTDHAAISYDQTSMEGLLAGQTAETFTQAQRVYTEGGNSKTIANLAVAGLPTAVADGTTLTALGVDGRSVVGTAEGAHTAGDTTLMFQYPVTDAMDDHLDCRVGGLPVNEHITDGCVAENGTVTINQVATPVSYTYTIETDNDNTRTLQGFSTDANTRMRPGDNLSADYFPEFQMFFDYYNSATYADDIVMAGFEGTDTSLTNGNIAASSLTYEGRVEIVKKGTAYMNVAMYVIRELEDAIYDCRANCEIGNCNDDAAVHALDEAVAFYYGTDDNFLHSLANKRCANFATCSGDNPVEGDAKVNDKVFQLFGQMQEYLSAADCDSAEPYVHDIATQIWIPIIQGTLRYAWILDDTNNPGALLTEKAQAEGAIFAAAVLPVIHNCDSEAAATIYDNMKIDSDMSVDFPAVKQAFESCYNKIGITCADVGGNVNSALTGYDANVARPCQFGSANAFGGSSASTVAVGSFVGATVLAAVAMLL